MDEGDESMSGMGALVIGLALFLLMSLLLVVGAFLVFGGTAHL